MKFSINTNVILIVVIALFSNYSYSDAFDRYDQLPLNENDLNLLNLDILGYQDKKNELSLRLLSLDEMNFGIVYTFSEIQEIGNPKKYEIIYEGLDISFADENKFLQGQWDNIFSLQYKNLKSLNLNCYENSNHTISMYGENCAVLGKNNISLNQGDYIFDKNLSTISLFIGLKSQSTAWNTKNIISLGINNSLINSKPLKNINLQNLITDNSDYFFGNKSNWISNDLMLKVSSSKSINKWGISGELSSTLTKTSRYNLNDLKNLNKTNYKVNLGINRIFNNFYIGLGVNYFNKRGLGYNPLEYAVFSHNEINKSETIYYSKFGYILNKDKAEINNAYNFLIANNLNNKDFSINRKPKKDNIFSYKDSYKKLNDSNITIIKNNKNQNEEFKDTNLFEYALIFAKKYDQIENLN